MRGEEWGSSQGGGTRGGIEGWEGGTDRREGGHYGLEMIMLSESDVNCRRYILNRYSRLGVRAGPFLSGAGTDKWNIFRGLNQGKMGFHLLAYPLCRPHTEMIACRSSFPRFFLPPSHRTWLLNPAEVTDIELITPLPQRAAGTWKRCCHNGPWVMQKKKCLEGKEHI